MNSKVYDVLKWLNMVGLPAIGAAYVGLAKIWGFPYPNEISGTIVVVCTLLGSFLGISSSQYYKGLGNGVYEDGKGEDDEQ
ncbi:MAG: phage holin [Oscillospiraceae bacterium]|nr:phage holin [Oscillospiraceae bacterium]MBQ8996386.1 phage holin [Oscillospiraceae bacterium]